MLAAIRTFAKSWVAAVLIGLLIVSFAVFGINDVFTGSFKDWVIQAGGRTVSSVEFRREFDAQKRRIEQQQGQPIPLELAVERGLDRQVLQVMADREAFAAFLQKVGLYPSDKLVVDEIAKIPAFFDPVSGRFDKTAYQRQLAEANFTTEQFEQMARDDIAAQMALTGVVAGARAPRAMSALNALYGLENRDLAWFSVTPAMVGTVAPPTEAQLQAFMKENAQQLTRPEFRVLQVVRFTPDAVGALPPVDPAELQKRYEFRKDTYSTPETRTVVQIPAKDQAAAQSIAGRLQAGEDPQAVARALKVDAISYDNRPKTAFPDRAIADAVFRLGAGQVAPVQSGLGWQVVKVVGVTPGREITLEEARPVLEAEIRKDQAAEKVLAQTTAYEEAHTAGGSLAESAAKAGVPVVTVGPVTQGGRDEQNQPVAGLTQKLVEAAFALPSGGESELVEDGENSYFAVRVERIVPPALPPLDAALRAELSRVWVGRETLKRMETRATALSERVRKGEAIDAVAGSVGAKVVRVAGLSRQTAGQVQTVSRDVLGQAFTVKPGETFTARDLQFAMAVGKLEAVRPGDPALTAQITAFGRDQMSAELFKELEESARLGARAAMKVKANEARARAALGLEPESLEGKAAGKAEK
ncbi:peptidylprolyl isomerase [Phenylobacterium sp. J367]|uniref:peptidylprolyl isomerase n=1 Tax=Phenylobacterium sp. J367 TaxID=2898435 RepID=UPI002150C3AF|nr:peptidylprolyl isomerase [Phenylobacterium sp. J367]MCR5880450.1 SurA N-terminal domain-containing protein [Phenylobacterium sp. J367]